MVTLRPAILRPAALATLGLAALFGMALGRPAVTSQPSGFMSSTEQAALPASTTAPAVSSQGVLKVPPPPVLLALLRGTLAAVNQANVTGNYSVLRDLGAPAFRENYNAAELADRFRPWRDNALDFAAILLLDAKLTRAPSLDAEGVLRLTGYFPTAPLRIGFDLGFRAIGGNWRLSTISVDARPTEGGDQPVANAAPQAPHKAPVPPQASAAPVAMSAPAKVAAPAFAPAWQPPAPSRLEKTAPAAQVEPFSATASRPATRAAPFSMQP